MPEERPGAVRMLIPAGSAAGAKLQQHWTIITPKHDGPADLKEEWRDVPWVQAANSAKPAR